MSVLGERLKELRNGVSQQEFSLQCGVKQTTYSSWERGIKEPAASNIALISRAFGVSADWLLGLSDKPPAAPSITAGGDVVVGNGSRITKTVHAAPPAAPCAKCPYKALVARLQRAGMTFPELAQ